MPQPDPLIIHPTVDGCRFQLRVKPRAGRDQILGVHGGSLKLGVREAPERGRANRAVCAFLARVLGIDAGAVEIVTGTSAQTKAVRVIGLDADECRRRLRRAGAES